MDGVDPPAVPMDDGLSLFERAMAASNASEPVRKPFGRPANKFNSGFHTFDKSREDGLRAEKVFQEWVATTGEFRMTEASTSDNRKAHWDVLIERKCDSLGDPTRKRMRVDVKDCKSASRADGTPFNGIWIELHNDFGGGWLFGDADIIAFKQPSGEFLLVDRESLADWVMENMDAEDPSLYTSDNKANDNPPSLSWVYCRTSRFNRENPVRLTTATVEDVVAKTKTYKTVNEWFE